MHSNAGYEKVQKPVVPTATRWATNHDWTRRGDNTKYKETK